MTARRRGLWDRLVWQEVQLGSRVVRLRRYQWTDLAAWLILAVAYVLLMLMLAGCDRPGTRCTAWSSDNRCVKTSSR